MRLIASDCALAAEVSLQIGHQESGRDSLACNIGKDQSELVVAKIKEIEIIAADMAGLNASAGVIHRFGWRHLLGKQPRLHLPGNLKLGCRAALGFKFFRS